MESPLKVHNVPTLLKRYQENRFNITLADRETADTAHSSVLFFRARGLEDSHAQIQDNAAILARLAYDYRF